ncbi:MAG: hypothetical protein WBF33_05165, partial [Candidatus Nitrosopolaris sp.]
VCTEEGHDRKLLQGCKAARVWRVQVQKERSGAYTCAPSLSGLSSPRIVRSEINQILDKQYKNGLRITMLLMGKG